MTEQQRQSTVAYLTNEYQCEMRTALAAYLSYSSPNKPMVTAMAEVKVRFMAKCQERGLQWNEILRSLDKQVGYGESRRMT